MSAITTTVYESETETNYHEKVEVKEVKKGIVLPVVLSVVFVLIGVATFALAVYFVRR